MEEDNNKNIDTNEILKETSSTFNEVKDQVKESFKKDEFKNSAKETKNFIIGMFKNPIEELKNIANDSSNSNFKYAIILVVIWIATILLLGLISYFKSIFKSWSSLFAVIKSSIAPILVVFVMSIIVMIMNKKKDKSLVTILTVITAAKLPVVIANVINLLRIISYKVSTVTSPFYSLCSVVSIVLTYFGIKFVLNEEDDNTYIKKFVLIEAIYFLVSIIVGLFDISI